MNPFTRRVLFFLFFLSGFSSLVYQVVWTRMAFASFGIITPVLSVVISVFMLGLAIGSWAGGRWVGAWARSTGLSAAVFYAGAELVIGLGAFVVPKLFALGENLLLASGETNSFRYLALSALVLAASILPWCVCMGATFPLMMAYVRERDDREAQSFSFLYLANVLGAMSGTFMSAIVWIEMLGFRHTLWLTAAGNFVIAFVAVCLGLERRAKAPATGAARVAPAAAPGSTGASGGMIKWLLFTTGFVAMAMEVVWTRAFTPVLKTQVYSFAAILFVYLGATFLGSLVYRRHLRSGRPRSLPVLMALLAVAAFLPVLANDPRLVVADWAGARDPLSALLLLASIGPMCALLGYLTPCLIDEYAGGHPERAGQAYALNVLGCILGPLLAGYFLMPQMSEHHALILLALPFPVFYFLTGKFSFHWKSLAWGATTAVVLADSLFFVQDFEGNIRQTVTNATIRRDYAASVISFGEGRQRMLLVNGIGMTYLTPITKYMVHLPLAFHPGPSQSALVICFGMGTSYRSALSWNLNTTVVELVPSVPKAFGFYHADAARSLNDTNGTIVIDDGRRFLKRTARKFDVIVVDPPPPTWAAGSSLLYSKEFCELARQHLNPGGILQMWFPGGEIATGSAVVRSITETFPQVRVLPSVERWGIHILSSMEPIAPLDADQLAARLPANAVQDLLEWNDSSDVRSGFKLMLSKEVAAADLLNPDPTIRITDDHPFNEYFLLRRNGF